LTVKTERPLSEAYTLLDGDLNWIEVQTQRKSGVPDPVKKAFVDILARRRRIEALSGQADGKDARIKSIDSDQDRIRRNMSALDRNSSLYLRYVKELTDQEDAIQTLRGDVAKLRASIETERASLSAFLDSLTIGG
jgi:SMC interacting uncharacterized protein involved in chromosome segregation